MSSHEVANLLAHLREEVCARRKAMITDEEYAAQAAMEQQLQRCAEQLEMTRVISAHWPLSGRTIPERFMALFNRLVRRYLRWYINPIVDQQNEFNDVAARTLRLLIEAHSDLYQQLSSLEPPPPTHTADAQRDDDDSDAGGSSGGGQHGKPATPSYPRQQGNVEQEQGSTSPLDSSDTPTSTIQAYIEHQAQDEPPATFPDVQLRFEPRKLALHQQVQAHWQLSATTPLQRGLVMVHKVVRYLLRWWINPIVEQQNSFNAALTETITPLMTSDGDKRAMLAERRARSLSRSL